MPRSDRPRFRINADRQSASRRVRYVETNQPDEGECTICILDELAEVAERPAATPTPGTAEEKSEKA